MNIGLGICLFADATLLSMCLGALKVLFEKDEYEEYLRKQEEQIKQSKRRIAKRKKARSVKCLDIQGNKNLKKS